MQSSKDESRSNGDDVKVAIEDVKVETRKRKKQDLTAQEIFFNHTIEFLQATGKLPRIQFGCIFEDDMIKMQCVKCLGILSANYTIF